MRGVRIRLSRALIGLQHDDGSVDVHPGTALGICTAERHLQRCEVDDVRDLVLVESRAHSRCIGHVAFDERDPCALILRQNEPQPRVVRAEVEPDGLLPELQQRLQRPCTEAPERARDQSAVTLRQAARPGRP